MKVVIFVDARNFEQGFYSLCRKREEFRYIDFYKINSFIMKYLGANFQYTQAFLHHVRTYFYTGEFTDNLIKKIEKFAAGVVNKEEIEKMLTKAKKDYEKQSMFFRLAKNYYFFEIKTKPLQFSPSERKIAQKGVDVQLAVDLVDFSHKDVFDIAVVLSGDIDLLESIKTVKNMGKQVIIFGENETTADEMKKYADLFVDIGRFTTEQLNAFSHIPQIKREEGV